MTASLVVIRLTGFLEDSAGAKERRDATAMRMILFASCKANLKSKKSWNKLFLKSKLLLLIKLNNSMKILLK